MVHHESEFQIQNGTFTHCNTYTSPSNPFLFENNEGNTIFNGATFNNLQTQVAPIYFSHNEAEITLTVSNLSAVPVQFTMSRTSPGRYALHEFAKGIGAMTDPVLFPAVHLSEGNIIPVGLENGVVSMPLRPPHRPDDAALHGAWENFVVSIRPCKDEGTTKPGVPRL